MPWVRKLDISTTLNGQDFASPIEFIRGFKVAGANIPGGLNSSNIREWADWRESLFHGFTPEHISSLHDLEILSTACPMLVTFLVSHKVIAALSFGGGYCMLSIMFEEKNFSKLCRHKIDILSAFKLPSQIQHKYFLNFTVDRSKMFIKATFIIGACAFGSTFPLVQAWGSGAAGFTAKFFKALSWNKK